MLDQAEAHQHQQEQEQEQTMVIKGKRSKRPRPASPLTPLVTTMSTSSSGLDDISTSTTQEEEDMAYCLILLAQGGGGTKTETYQQRQQQQQQQQQSSVAVVYECKTCNRCFPSFQALGGHRASHKKPKTMTSPPPPEPERRSVEAGGFTVGVGLSLQLACNSSNTLTAINFSPNVPNKLKVHACGICRAEFSSGQALGGHMRRHRSPVAAGGSTPATQSASSPPINLQLCLDLNLPAEEEHQEAETPKFMFGSNENTLVFTAGALVDCRY